MVHEIYSLARDWSKASRDPRATHRVNKIRVFLELRYRKQYASRNKLRPRTNI